MWAHVDVCVAGKGLQKYHSWGGGGVAAPPPLAAAAGWVLFQAAASAERAAATLPNRRRPPAPAFQGLRGASNRFSGRGRLQRPPARIPRDTHQDDFGGPSFSNGRNTHGGKAGWPCAAGQRIEKGRRVAYSIKKGRVFSRCQGEGRHRAMHAPGAGWLSGCAACLVARSLCCLSRVRGHARRVGNGWSLRGRASAKDAAGELDAQQVNRASAGEQVSGAKWLQGSGGSRPAGWQERHWWLQSLKLSPRVGHRAC